MIRFEDEEKEFYRTNSKQSIDIGIRFHFSLIGSFRTLLCRRVEIFDETNCSIRSRIESHDGIRRLISDNSLKLKISNQCRNQNKSFQQTCRTQL